MQELKGSRMGTEKIPKLMREAGRAEHHCPSNHYPL